MWAISKALLIPLDKDIESIEDIPHTISYVIRKRQQVDGLMELPEEKRPPDNILWHNNPDILSEWLDRVLERKGKNKGKEELEFNIPKYEIEG